MSDTNFPTLGSPSIFHSLLVNDIAELSEPTSNQSHFPVNSRLIGSALICAFGASLSFHNDSRSIDSQQWIYSDSNSPYSIYFGAPKLQAIYVKSNSDEIENFLVGNPKLTKVLNEFSVILGRDYLVSDILLEYFRDDYTEIEALLITPSFSTTDLDALIDIETEILESFFYPRRSAINESLILSI